VVGGGAVVVEVVVSGADVGAAASRAARMRPTSASVIDRCQRPSRQTSR
jgi:hypothetical protein